MSGLTLAKGNLSAGNGAGILDADEQLDLTNMVFSKNTAVGSGAARLAVGVADSFVGGIPL